MKHYISGMVIALALALALVMGVVALAENAGNEALRLPSVEDVQTAPEVQAPEAQQPEAQVPQADADDNAALQEALKAYDEARRSAREEDLQAELDGYVEAGKLTREQADLILNYVKERDALRNGTCPACGYQFQNGQGKGGRMNGNGGFGGGNGFGGNNGRGGRHGFDGQSMPGMQNDGMNAAPDMQGARQMNAFGGI